MKKISWIVFSLLMILFMISMYNNDINSLVFFGGLALMFQSFAHNEQK